MDNGVNVLYYTVKKDGTVISHVEKQLELPFGPSDPGRVVKLRPASHADEIVDDEDNISSDEEVVA